MKTLNKLISITLCASMALALTSCAKDLNGKYRAKVECSDLFANSFSEGAGMDIDFEGELEAEFILTMINGDYWLELDTDKFETDLTGYIYDNLDPILYALFDTDDQSELAEYATYMGYSNYDEMKDAMYDVIMEDFDINDFKLNENGSYIVVGDTIRFDSDSEEDFEGKVDGKTITIKMESDEAAFGSDNMELVFEFEEEI